jgi:hypothetical protein
MLVRNAKVLLNAVVATGAGTEVFDCPRLRDFTFFIQAASVTTGATLKIQSISPSGQWHDVATIAVTANGNTVSTVTGAHEQLRANITARTDGTYTVGVIGQS